MATFRSILSQRVLVVAILVGSFLSLGAAFAPSGPSFQVPLDPIRLSSSLESRTVSDLMEAKSSRGGAQSRLEELLLTHRAVAVSV